MAGFISKNIKWIKITLLLIVVIAVSQFLWHSDFDVIGAYLKKMPATFLAIIGVSFLSYFLATYAWKICLGEESKKVNLWQLFMMRHVGEMLTLFNPTSIIAGEGLKAHYLNQQSVAPEVGLRSVVISRVLLILSALFLMVVSILYLTIGNSSSNFLYILIAIVSISIFGYLVARMLLHSRLYLHRVMVGMQRKIGSKWISDSLIDSVHKMNESCYQFYKNHKLSFLGAFLLSALHWVLGSVEFYLILVVLGIEIGIVDAVAMEMGVQVFKSVGAIIPGQIGIEEYANKIMLGIVGVASAEVWVVVSIIRRARQIFWLAVAGVFFFILSKNKSAMPSSLQDT